MGLGSVDGMYFTTFSMWWGSLQLPQRTIYIRNISRVCGYLLCSLKSKGSGMTKADEAYLMLAEMIETGQVEPGTFHTEVGLVEEMGLSRTPLREAVQRLDRDHLVRIRPGRRASPPGSIIRTTDAPGVSSWLRASPSSSCSGCSRSSSPSA